jgi:hypothetical protein
VFVLDPYGVVGKLLSDFRSTASFTRFRLAAFDTRNSSIPLGIDNLAMTIPEPATFALTGLGAAKLMILRRRR